MSPSRGLGLVGLRLAPLAATAVAHCDGPSVSPLAVTGPGVYGITHDDAGVYFTNPLQGSVSRLPMLSDGGVGPP